MPATKYVLGHLFGTHRHAIAHWFGDIRPSITFEPAVFAILLTRTEIIPMLLASSRAKCQDMKTSDATPRSSVAPRGWDQYAWADPQVHRYPAIDHF